eukprot:6208151-Pleurochrysis_carterae.AAC.1
MGHLVNIGIYAASHLRGSGFHDRPSFQCARFRLSCVVSFELVLVFTSHGALAGGLLFVFDSSWSGFSPGPDRRHSVHSELTLFHPILPLTFTPCGRSSRCWWVDWHT